VVWQNQTFQSGVTGITSALATNGYVMVEAGSGQYHFRAE